MLYLSILLHIYQPPTQDPEITKKISQNSYRLILKILKETKGKITLNIPASLSEQLVSTGGEDIISGIIDLVKKKQIELTATAAYHAILPRLPETEIKRQITLNNYINKKILGSKIYCPDGFFPPEMAYSSRLGRVLEDMNFKWVILSELAYKREYGKVKHDVIYVKRDNTNLNYNSYKNYNGYNSDRESLQIFFRDDRLSNAVALSQAKTLFGFLQLIDCFHPSSIIHHPSSNNYYIIALDGETFGHHQIGQDKLLTDILSYYKSHIVTISELGKYIRTKRYIRPKISSWGDSADDLRKKIYWPKWSYPGNRIHKLQWQLTNIAIKYHQPSTIHNLPSVFDKALHSDQYWWASRRPYWHPEMVKKGADLLLKSIVLNPRVKEGVRKEAERIYNDILEECRKYGDKIVV